MKRDLGHTKAFRDIAPIGRDGARARWAALQVTEQKIIWREPPLPQQYSRLQKLLAVPPQRPDGNIRQSDVAPAGPGLCRLETDAPFFLLFALHGRRVGQALAPKAPWSR